GLPRFREEDVRLDALRAPLLQAVTVVVQHVVVGDDVAVDLEGQAGGDRPLVAEAGRAPAGVVLQNFLNEEAAEYPALLFRQHVAVLGAGAEAPLAAHYWADCRIHAVVDRPE